MGHVTDSIDSKVGMWVMSQTARWVCGSCDRQQGGYVGHVTDRRSMPTGLHTCESVCHI